MTQTELDLLHGYLSGTLDEADFARLESLLNANADARQMLRTLSTVEIKLQQFAAGDPDNWRLLGVPSEPEAKSYTRRLSRRPLATVAAGAVLGMFCTTVVFAYLSRSQELQAPLAVAETSFEELRQSVKPGFPQVAGVWQGDEGVRERRSDAPAGSHALRLDPVKSGARQFSFVHQIVPVNHVGRLELSAAFHAGGQVRQRCMTRVACYDVPAEMVKTLAPNLLEEATGSAQRVVTCDGDGWHRVPVSLQLPPGTRCVVVSLGARTLDAAAQPCFVDDVKADLFVAAP